MTTLTLKEHLDHAEHFCRSYFNTCGELAPMIDAIDDTGTHHVMLVPQLGGHDHEKDAIAKALASFFKEKQIIQYVMMMEAWALVIKDKKIDPNNAPRPSMHPNRQEIVALTGENWKGENIGRHINIDRRSGKPKLTNIADFGNNDGETKISGRFCHLLQKPTQH